MEKYECIIPSKWFSDDSNISSFQNLCGAQTPASPSGCSLDELP